MSEADFDYFGHCYTFFQTLEPKVVHGFSGILFLVWKILEYMTMVLPLQKEISICCRASVAVGAVK